MCEFGGDLIWDEAPLFLTESEIFRGRYAPATDFLWFYLTQHTGGKENVYF